MIKYTYYEVHYQGKTKKDWYIWTDTRELREAREIRDRIKKIPQNARVVQVDVHKTLVT